MCIARKKIEEMQDNIYRLEAIIDDQASKITKLTTELNMSLKDLSTTKEKVKELQTDLQTKEKIIADLKNKKATAQTKKPKTDTTASQLEDTPTKSKKKTTANE